MNNTIESRMWIDNAGNAVVVIAKNGSPVYGYLHQDAANAVEDLLSICEHGFTCEAGELEEWISAGALMENIWAPDMHLLAEVNADGNLWIDAREQSGSMQAEIIRLLTA